MKHNICIFSTILILAIAIKAQASEIKSSKQSIVVNYEDPKHKFIAHGIFNLLEDNVHDWNTIIGLKPIEPITIYICKNELKLNSKKLPFDLCFIPNNKNKLFLIIENNQPLDSVQNWPEVLFYQWSKCLFRQHKIPYNALYESAYLIWLTHSYMGWSEASLPFALSSRVSFQEIKNEFVQSEKWYDPNYIQDKLMLANMRLIKHFTLLLISFKYEHNLSNEILQYKVLKNLKKFKPWQEIILVNKWNSSLFNAISKKRNVYTQVLESFNFPRSNLTWNTEAKPILREILRIYFKDPKLAKDIFSKIALYPIDSSLFCETGLYLNPKENGLSEHIIWLEYYLINQKNEPIEKVFEPDSILKIVKSFPEKEIENDQIKLLQFMTFFVMKKNLQNYIKISNIESTSNTILLNHIFAIQYLLEEKNIENKIKVKFKYTKNLLWPTLNDILN